MLNVSQAPVAHAAWKQHTHYTNKRSSPPVTPLGDVDCALCALTQETTAANQKHMKVLNGFRERSASTICQTIAAVLHPQTPTPNPRTRNSCSAGTSFCGGSLCPKAIVSCAGLILPDLTPLSGREPTKDTSRTRFIRVQGCRVVLGFRV